jgi:hypothetical protein
MTLPLVELELVQTIKPVVSLAVAVIHRAGMLRGAVLFPMAAEVTSASDSYSTAWMVALKAIDIDVVASGCSGTICGNRQFGGEWGGLDFSACADVQFRGSSGD